MTQLSRGRQITLYGSLAVMLAGVLIRYGSGDQNQVVASHDSIPVAKQRLEILRRKAATVASQGSHFETSERRIGTSAKKASCRPTRRNRPAPI